MKYANWDALARIASEKKPKAYLEIGVLAGKSLEVVLDYCNPERLVLCDSWSPSYKGSVYRDHQHIQALLDATGFTGSVKYLDGDSHVLLKTLDETFDLIHIDGDHSFEGALADLRDCWRLLGPWGHIILDDLTHAPSVEKALDEFEKETDNCAIWREKSKADGVAILLKIK